MSSVRQSGRTGSLSAGAPFRPPDPFGARAALGISPEVLVEVIKRNATRRPLWPVKLVENFFDFSREQIMERIESGEFAWAFDIGTGNRKGDHRILAHSVLEKTMGLFKEIGQTRNLGLAQVINLVLPQRDVRSTELKRIFSCSSDKVHKLGGFFKTVKAPKVKDGPNSYAVFSRASVARFLEKRRIA